MPLFVFLVNPASVPAGEPLYYQADSYNGPESPNGVSLPDATVFDQAEADTFYTTHADLFDGVRGFVELPSVLRKA